MDFWKKTIEEVLEQVRPALREHGGDAKLLGVEGKKVRLELHGACAGCPMSSLTFGVMVEEMIKEKIPEVEEVVYQ
ncbi:NifU family protein [Patescibacteria group bacterium]|nr:MAG: NifU family protein [Patescibacteria group bacterium]